MVKFTQDMKDIFNKARIFIMATASKEGKPNGVPMGVAWIVSDDEIMLVDNFMNKTRRNIEENPRVAVSFWNPKGPGGYQFKGKARVETSGKHFDRVVHRIQSEEHPFPIKTKAVVIIKVDEIYRVGANVDCGTNLAEQEI
jgi:predicted pyridoxine 5'-phosphate oxidase superfamily flavin-nucleotide-binding protein